nr:reverse transcriptase domain-containing protein [Tanacetum cinerariifolium]
MDATPRVNIQDFYKEYYEDILPLIMDKIHHDKRKEVHARLDFEEGSKERRIKEGSHYSSARTLSAWYHNQSERLKVRDRLIYNDRNVLDRLGHRRQSASDRLSKTYSPSVTKSRPDRTSPKDRSRNRSRPHRRDSSNGDCSQSRECSRGVGESYLNSHSSYRTNHGYRYRDRDRSHRMNRERDSESPLSRQKKYVKDPVEIHNIKQKDGEIIEDFMERFKVETGRMKGAPECMQIFGFMHGVNNLELTKCLNEHVSKTIEETMITTAAFIRDEAVALEKRKVTHHGEHRTSQSGTLQRRGLTSEGRDQSKVGKKKAPAKEKPMAIYMIQSWHRMTRQKVTQSFECVREITFPSLATKSGTEGPLVM